MLWVYSVCGFVAHEKRSKGVAIRIFFGVSKHLPWGTSISGNTQSGRDGKVLVLANITRNLWGLKPILTGILGKKVAIVTIICHSHFVVKLGPET